MSFFYQFVFVYSAALMRRIFSKFDRDGNGTLDRKELQGATAFLGDRFSDEDTALLMEVLDKDDSDSIDMEEFIQAFVNARRWKCLTSDVWWRWMMENVSFDVLVPNCLLLLALHQILIRLLCAFSPFCIQAMNVGARCFLVAFHGHLFHLCVCCYVNGCFAELLFIKL